jgi:hypothetical protein
VDAAFASLRRTAARREPGTGPVPGRTAEAGAPPARSRDR